MSRFIASITGDRAFVPDGTAQKELTIVRYANDADTQALYDHVLLTEADGTQCWWKYHKEV